MKISEYKYGNVTVRVHDPERTPEQEKERDERIRKAVERYARAVFEVDKD